jgi:hypothetical protein
MGCPVKISIEELPLRIDFQKVVVAPGIYLEVDRRE